MRVLGSLPAVSILLFGCVTHAADAVPKGQLPRTVVPTLVRLELKLDPAQPRFSGKVRIEAKVAQATDTIWMHARSLTISKAEAIAGAQRFALTAESADVSGVLKLSAREKIPVGVAAIEIAYDAPFGELQGAYRVKPDGNDYIVTQMEPLSMSWCLDCHRDPAKFRRPVSEVTNMRWTPPKDAAALQAKLAGERPVNPPVDCSGCHR